MVYHVPPRAGKGEFINAENYVASHLAGQGIMEQMAKELKKGRFELTLLDPSDFKEMPWKNGKGSSREIVREPAGKDDFSYRVSTSPLPVGLQDNDSDLIPFSLYPGYQRVLILLSGESLITPMGTIKKHEILTFDGGQEVKAKVVTKGKEASDLGFIYNPKKLSVETHILRVDKKPKSYGLDPLQMIFFALEGNASLSFYPGELKMNLKEGQALLMKQKQPDPLELSSVLVEASSSKFVFAAFGLTPN